MTKIGLLGGAFNPPTTGHIKLAEHVLKNTDLDEVWLSPCHEHKYGKDLVHPQHRLDMCAIASRHNPNIHVFDYEIRHEMDGSVFDFVTKLINDPQLDVELSYIIGQDNANGFDKWHRHEELQDLLRFIVVGRTGVEVDEDTKWYKKDPHTYLPWENMKTCSSTDIRDHIKENGRGAPISILDPKVQEYIVKKKIYRYSNPKDEEVDLLKLAHLTVMAGERGTPKEDFLSAMANGTELDGINLVNRFATTFENLGKNK